MGTGITGQVLDIEISNGTVYACNNTDVFRWNGATWINLNRSLFPYQPVPISATFKGAGGTIKPSPLTSRAPRAKEADAALINRRLFNSN